MCQAAGLKLAALTPRMFGIGGCFARLRDTPLLVPPAAADANVAVVALGERWAEFTVFQGDTVVLARSMTNGPNIAGEIRRNLAVYAGQFPQHPVTALYVNGAAEQLDLQQKLQGLVPVPVALCDPFGPVDRPNLPTTGRSGFSGALGLIFLEAAGEKWPINFVRPKQPIVKRDPNRRIYVLAACGVLLLAVLGIGFLFWTASNTDRKIRELEARKKDLDGMLAQMDIDDKRFKALEDWNKGEVVWLDELYDLTGRFGETKGVRLLQMTGDPLPRTAKSEYVARVMIKGVAGDDPRPVDALLAEYVRDGHYRVEPKTMKPNRSSGRGEGFSQEFLTKVDLKPRVGETYVRRLPDPVVKKPEKKIIPRDPGEADVFGELP
jgi:hypothetical protein